MLSPAMLLSDSLSVCQRPKSFGKKKTKKKPQPATSCTNISRGKVPHKFQFNATYTKRGATNCKLKANQATAMPVTATKTAEYIQDVQC